MRSQVHIQPLPQVQVPDNTQTLNLMQRLGDQLGTMRKEKEATELTNQLMNNESREDALKSQAIMAEEETAINQVREKAQTAQSAVRSQSRIKSMMNDQDQRQAFMRLHKIDPNAARMVMSVFAAEDEEQKQILAQEAHAARVFNHNVMGLNANGQHDDAKAVLMAKAKQVNDAGVPPEQNEYLQMANYSPEQLQQALLAKQSLAGEAIKIAEKQGFIQLSEGQVLLDGSGNPIYKNNKDRSMSDYEAAKIGLDYEKLQHEKSNQKPQKRETVLQDGVHYYKDNGERVLPNVKGKGQDTDQVWNTFNLALNEVEGSLSKISTGSISGYIPNITTDRKVAEGAIALMAPVLKDIFRSAGEGTFTKDDQEVLMRMLPDKHDTEESARVKIANVRKIVASKLGQNISQPGDTQSGGNEPSDDELLNLYLSETSYTTGGI